MQPISCFHLYGPVRADGNDDDINIVLTAAG